MTRTLASKSSLASVAQPRPTNMLLPWSDKPQCEPSRGISAMRMALSMSFGWWRTDLMPAALMSSSPNSATNACLTAS
eukprot:65800-Alexandrium_andersonii.AAC.1